MRSQNTVPSFGLVTPQRNFYFVLVIVCEISLSWQFGLLSPILCTEGGNSLYCTDNIWTNISYSRLKKKNGTRAHSKENNLR